MPRRSAVPFLSSASVRIAALTLCAVTVASTWAQPLAGTAKTPLAPSPGDAKRFHASLEATRFRALLDNDWQWQAQQYPERATAAGDHRYDDQLTDASPEAVARREEHDRAQLKALRKIDLDVLTGEDRISYDFALQQAQMAVDKQRYPVLRTRVLSAVDGVQVELPSMMSDFPMRTELDARHALARLQAMPRRIAQDIAWLREGQRLGWVTFKPSLSQVPDQIDRLLAKAPTEQPLLAPFTRLPADMPAERRTALQDEAANVLQTQVAPAFLELRRVVVEELLPASPDNGALSAYPDGDAIYKLFVRDQATLALDAKAIHETGVAEMARLHAQIAAVMKQAGFAGSEADFADQLARDPKSWYSNADDLLAGYRDLAKRIDPMLTQLFLVLPRTPYGIRAAPGNPGASMRESYSPGAADGSTPGWVNANVAALAQRPRWGTADLLLHEGVPGHHLQAARAHEFVQLPMFRRMADPNAYVAGWALYAEDLGDELGLHDDPSARYGHLHAQAWRTGLLVVDTGIHALGWTRAQAVDYLVDEAGLARDDATTEVDRCYVRPARALGGKLGELKLLELRQKAREALGNRFDPRAFNQELIDHGALPLPLLERVIGDWTQRVLSGTALSPIADAR